MPYSRLPLCLQLLMFINGQLTFSCYKQLRANTLRTLKHYRCAMGNFKITWNFYTFDILYIEACAGGQVTQESTSQQVI